MAECCSLHADQSWGAPEQAPAGPQTLGGSSPVATVSVGVTVLVGAVEVVLCSAVFLLAHQRAGMFTLVVVGSYAFIR